MFLLTYTQRPLTRLYLFFRYNERMSRKAETTKNSLSSSKKISKNVPISEDFPDNIDELSSTSKRSLESHYENSLNNNKKSKSDVNNSSTDVNSGASTSTSQSQSSENYLIPSNSLSILALLNKASTLSIPPTPLGDTSPFNHLTLSPTIPQTLETTNLQKILPKPTSVELLRTTSMMTLSDEELLKKMPKTSHYRMQHLLKNGKDISKYLNKFRKKCPYCFRPKTPKSEHRVYNSYVFCPQNPHNLTYEEWIFEINNI